MFFIFLLYVWVLYVDCMCVLENYFSIRWFLCLFFILMLRCLFLISLVSYQNNFIFFQRHCALRVNFLILVFTFDLYSFPYLLYVLRWNFQVSQGQEKFIWKYFSGKFPLYSLFSSISHCASFFSFIFAFYLLTACMY